MQAGWELFKRQLLLHHTTEDEIIWPALRSRLAHEERDGLPLIGVTLTAAEWRGAGRAMARKNGLSASAEMFAWILDGTDIARPPWPSSRRRSASSTAPAGSPASTKPPAGNPPAAAACLRP